MKTSLIAISQPQRSLYGKSLNYFKTQAKILLKQLRNSDLVLEDKLKHRLTRASALSLLENPEIVKLKHVLTIIARENGFSDWSELKKRLDIESTLGLDIYFCRGIFSGMLNHWFTRYDDAKAFHDKNGGIILPYRHQYFVAATEFLVRLDIPQNDSDWKAIGYDWIKPKSEEARDRIIHRLLKREANTHV